MPAPRPIRETQQAKRDLSEANLERARALYGQGTQAISKAQLETAEENLRVDDAALAAAQSQLVTLSNTAIQAWARCWAKRLPEPTRC